MPQEQTVHQTYCRWVLQWVRVLLDTVVTRLLQHENAPALSPCAAREGLLDVTRTLLIGLAAPRIPQISPHVPFVSSRGSNTAYEVIISRRLTTSREP